MKKPRIIAGAFVADNYSYRNLESDNNVSPYCHFCQIPAKGRFMSFDLQVK